MKSFHIFLETITKIEPSRAYNGGQGTDREPGDGGGVGAGGCPPNEDAINGAVWHLPVGQKAKVDNDDGSCGHVQAQLHSLCFSYFCLQDKRVLVASYQQGKNIEWYLAGEVWSKIFYILNAVHLILSWTDSMILKRMVQSWQRSFIWLGQPKTKVIFSWDCKTSRIVFVQILEILFPLQLSKQSRHKQSATTQLRINI